ATAASYAISVRQASALPSASFRFHLTVGTLAVRLVVPLAGPTEDLHLQVVPGGHHGGPGQRQSMALRAMPGAPIKKAPALPGLLVFGMAAAVTASTPPRTGTATPRPRSASTRPPLPRRSCSRRRNGP